MPAIVGLLLVVGSGVLLVVGLLANGIGWFIVSGATGLAGIAALLAASFRARSPRWRPPLEVMYDMRGDPRERFPRPADSPEDARDDEVVVYTAAAAGSEAPPAASVRRPPRIVSVGFAEGRDGPPLPSDRTLVAGRLYEVWLEIAPQPVTGAVRTRANRPLPQRLPAGTRLQVVLFGFDGELQPVPGEDIGVLQLDDRGSATVIQQPGGKPGGDRLYLSVTTPRTAGTHRVRCNVYYEQTLLQSRLLTAVVTTSGSEARTDALTAALDFAVVHDLDREHLSGRRPRTLSVLANDDGNGSHGFKFFGQNNFKNDVTLDAQTLIQEIEKARAGMRIVAWGANGEPSPRNPEMSFLFSHPNLDQLVDAVLVLARTGYQLFDLLGSQLGGDRADELRTIMKKPGRIEFANKASLDLLVPAACVYDYPMRWRFADKVCPEFLTSLSRKTPLNETACFSGDCPTYQDRMVVCPSGFWGFRHEISYSASLGSDPSDGATNQSLVVGASPDLLFAVGASSDDLLRGRDQHLQHVQALAKCEWDFAPTARELLELFERVSPSIVYLFGHGGIDEMKRPYFEIGTKTDGPIYRADLRDCGNWSSTHPLVFLNGCHSAALSPDAAFSYATGFLQSSHASAVVGTEIAIAESLAIAFAEDCLRRFIVDRKSLGEAVRETRLALLEINNPLGLAYLAFGPAEVRLGGCDNVC